MEASAAVEHMLQMIAPKYPQNMLMDFNSFFNSLYIYCTY